MKSETFKLTTSDGIPLHVYQWLPERAPHAIVQLAHGLPEHTGLYKRFAERSMTSKANIMCMQC